MANDSDLVDVKALKQDRSLLEDAVRRLGVDFQPGATKIKCPFHNEKSPSMAFRQSEDTGAWYVQCFGAGCGWHGDVIDVRCELEGITPKEYLQRLRTAQGKGARKTERIQQKRKDRFFQTIDEVKAAYNAAAKPNGGEVTRVHVYTNPKTKLHDAISFRLDFKDGTKQFRQAHQTPNGYVLKGPKEPWPLYNRTRLIKSPDVLVVEGEKCVEIANSIGIVATTSLAGAGKAARCDWSPLAGKTVYLWPDFDPVNEMTGKRGGFEHMADVAAMCEALRPKPRVFWIESDKLDLPEKGDLEDFLDLYPSLDEMAKRDLVLEVMRAGVPMGKTKSLRDHFNRVADGTEKLIDWPWPILTRQTCALLPGTVTVICGSPGASKSYMLLQALRFWCKAGIKCAALMLEDGATYHLKRALAQESETSDLMNFNWMRDNSDSAFEKLKRHEDFLETFSEFLFEPPKNQKVDVDFMIDWCARRLAEGNRIIAIDPITLSDSEGKVFMVDAKFMREVKPMAVDHGASVLVVTHPKKGAAQNLSAVHMDDVGGGASITRAAQCVLWLHWIEHTTENVLVPGLHGDEHERKPINRILKNLKTRNSFGQNQQLGFYFEGSSFLSFEQGVIA